MIQSHLCFSRIFTNYNTLQNELTVYYLKSQTQIKARSDTNTEITYQHQLLGNAVKLQKYMHIPCTHLIPVQSKMLAYVGWKAGSGMRNMISKTHKNLSQVTDPYFLSHRPFSVPKM